MIGQPPRLDDDTDFWPDVLKGIGKTLAVIFAVIFAVLAAYLILRGLYSWYYVQTHCTDVLGTRICQ